MKTFLIIDSENSTVVGHAEADTPLAAILKYLVEEEIAEDMNEYEINCLTDWFVAQEIPDFLRLAKA